MIDKIYKGIKRREDGSIDTPFYMEQGRSSRNNEFATVGHCITHASKQASKALPLVIIGSLPGLFGFHAGD